MPVLSLALPDTVVPGEVALQARTAVDQEQLRGGDSAAGARLGAVVNDGSMRPRPGNGGEAGLDEAALGCPPARQILVHLHLIERPASPDLHACDRPHSEACSACTGVPVTMAMFKARGREDATSCAPAYLKLSASVSVLPADVCISIGRILQAGIAEMLVHAACVKA